MPTDPEVISAQDSESSLEQWTVEAADRGLRLDQFLAARRPEYSRSFCQKAIEAGRVSVNGVTILRTSAKTGTGDLVAVDWPVVRERTLVPEPMDLAILFEDDDLLVLDKPAGLVVHPGDGQWEHTLVQGLLAHAPECFGHPDFPDPVRPGIVHRLDKETSGLLVVAKTPAAQASLQEAFKERETEKTYLAIVWGRPPKSEGRLETLMGRHPGNRLKRAVLHKSEGGKPAITRYQILAGSKDACLLQVRIETGRTHQIRVHMAHLHCPVVGDMTYGGQRPQDPRCPRRQMLHAWKLSFKHPRSGAELQFESPVPEDFAAVAAGFGLDLPEADA